jgi:hypothetical protein
MSACAACHQPLDELVFADPESGRRLHPACAAKSAVNELATSAVLGVGMLASVIAVVLAG